MSNTKNWNKFNETLSKLKEMEQMLEHYKSALDNIWWPNEDHEQLSEEETKDLYNEIDLQYKNFTSEKEG